MLTDAKARRISPGDGPLNDGSVAGLYLFPASQPGRGKWILRFVSPRTRKRRDMGLGTYPEIPIRIARETALRHRASIQNGDDPIVQRDQELAANHSMKVPTFAAAARLVHDELRRGFRNGKHIDQWINTLEDYAFPVIGDQSVDMLRPMHFADVLKPIWIAKPETASRVRQRCDTVMKWCAAQGFVVASPVSVVAQLLARQPGKRERTQHHPAVPWRKIPDFVRNHLRGKPVTSGREMLELLVLTAARSGEIRGMRWEEIDLDTGCWTIPPPG